MVAHPLRVRSTRCAVESEQNKLRRNFFPLVWFETFLWPRAAPQYSFGANACHDGEAQQRVGGLPHKRRVFVLVGIGASGSAVMQDFVGQNVRRGAIRSPRNKTPRLRETIRYAVRDAANYLERHHRCRTRRVSERFRARSALERRESTTRTRLTPKTPRSQK